MSLLESGAYTAVTRVDPKRIAVHLSSWRHDLLMVQNCFETNKVAKPDLWHNIQAVSGWDGRNTCVHANKSKQCFRDHGNVGLALTINLD